MNRTFLTAIFLSLFSQVAWSEIIFDREQGNSLNCMITNKTETPIHNNTAKRPELWQVFLSQNLVNISYKNHTVFFINKSIESSDNKNNHSKKNIFFTEDHVLATEDRGLDRYKIFIRNNGQFHFLADSGLGYAGLFAGNCK